MNEFLTYTRFNSLYESEDLKAFLQDNGIECIIKQEKPILDKIYIGETLDPVVELKIRKRDFTVANNLIISDYKIDTTQVDPNYYLLSFTNEELLDVVTKTADWNYFDIALAKTLLAEREIELPGEIESNTIVAYTPLKISNTILVIEYIVSVFFNFVGIVIALATLLAKKTLSDGQQVKIYNDNTRMHARIILAIGLIRTGIIFGMFRI